MGDNIENKVEQIEQKTKPKKPKISYCSWYEIDKFSREPKDYVDIPNYISLWAKKIEEVDPGGKKARELAEKYSR